jgi:hypothetical protein
MSYLTFSAEDNNLKMLLKIPQECVVGRGCAPDPFAELGAVGQTEEEEEEEEEEGREGGDRREEQARRRVWKLGKILGQCVKAWFVQT